MLIAPGTEGDVGILTDHAPMTALIRRGIGKVNAEGATQHYVFGEGVLEVTRKEVLLLVDTAEKAESLDAAKLMLVEHVAAAAGPKK
jgi:F-type H+-transporting ATPase subunit epsilon